MSENERDKDAVNPHTGRPMWRDPREAAARPGEAATSGAESEKPAAAGGGAPEGGAKPAAPAPPGGGSAGAPSQQEMAIRSALESVMDPEINLSVIDLGLIREIHLLPGRTLIKMMLTTPFCPYAPQLMEEVKQVTMGVVPVGCDVEILPDPWSPDLMPDPGLLGYSF